LGVIFVMILVRLLQVRPVTKENLWEQNFYRPDALAVVQPKASNHLRIATVSDQVVIKQHINSQTSDSNSASNTIIAQSHTKNSCHRMVSASFNKDFPSSS